MAETVRDKIAATINDYELVLDGENDDLGFDLADRIIRALGECDFGGLRNYAAGEYSRRNIEAFIQDVTGGV